MIDICDFAVGLSRQLYGRTMPSERPGHRLMETWHPLGVVGVISAFNFPVAVWSWNTAVALVCGDTVIWKPSEQAPLTAAASAALLDRALSEQGAPADVSQVLVGGGRGGAGPGRPPRGGARQRHRLDPHGPCGGPARRRAVRPLAAGARRQQRRRRRAVGRPRPGHPRHRVLGGRHGRPAVHHDAPGDRPLQRRSTSWSSGCRRPTRGCPSATRWRRGTLVGPLIHDAAFKAMQNSLEPARNDGGTVVVGGGRRLADAGSGRVLRRARARPHRRADRASSGRRPSRRSST